MTKGKKILRGVFATAAGAGVLALGPVVGAAIPLVSQPGNIAAESALVFATDVTGNDQYAKMARQREDADPACNTFPAAEQAYEIDIQHLSEGDPADLPRRTLIVEEEENAAALAAISDLKCTADETDKVMSIVTNMETNMLAAIPVSVLVLCAGVGIGSAVIARKKNLTL